MWDERNHDIDNGRRIGILSAPKSGHYFLGNGYPFAMTTKGMGDRHVIRSAEVAA
jgi:hypothetical protein